MRMTRAFCAIICNGSSLVTPIAPNACTAWSTISPGGKDLHHRRRLPNVLAAVEPLRRIVDHETTSMNVRDGVCNPPLDRLSIGERHAEGCSLLHMRTHHIKRSPPQPDCPGAYLQPAHVETKLHRREALTDFAEDRLCRQPHVVKNEFVGLVIADHRDFALNHEAIGPFLDDKGGDQGVLRLDLVGEMASGGDS